MNEKEALNILKNYTDLDNILSSYKDKNFYEFVISVGGDIYKYRVYQNRSVTIK